MIEPILEVLCHEAKGDVVRKIYPLIFTPESLKEFWEKSRKLRTLFSKEIQDDFTHFGRMFLSQDENGQLQANGLFFVVDDFVGVFYLTDIIVGLDASAHFMFYDKKLYGREPLFHALMKYVFDKYSFRRLTAEVPGYLSPRVHEFLSKEVKLRREGIKKKAAFYNNTYYDVTIFGILPEHLADMTYDNSQKTQESTKHEELIETT